MDMAATYTCLTDYAFNDSTIQRNATCEIKVYPNGTMYGEWTTVTDVCEREYSQLYVRIQSMYTFWRRHVQNQNSGKMGCAAGCF